MLIRTEKIEINSMHREAATENGVNNNKCITKHIV